MASTRDIRRRIKSVKNTSQITKAMQLVAAAKMKKAQDQAVAGRPYADMMNRVLVSLKDKIEDTAHPFFAPGTGTKELVVVITTDKGLCGALNTNLLRKIYQTYPSTGSAEVDYICMGRKGAQQMSRLKKHVIAEFTVKDPAKFPALRTIGNFIQEKFLTGEYASVKVAFSNFINTVNVQPALETLLPVNPVTLGGKRPHDKPEKEEPTALNPQYTFEPTPADVFKSILPQYVNNTLFQMMLESRASEHSSRMVAMKNATDNAKQMLKDLSLEYNKLRQASITNELLEITTAKMALE
jgi:F-type H+-transporting ATPase subunit gamma